MKTKLIRNTCVILSILSLIACFAFLETHYILSALGMLGFASFSKLGGLWYEKEEK